MAQSRRSAWLQPGVIGILVGFALLVGGALAMLSVVLSPDLVGAPARSARPIAGPAADAETAYERGEYGRALELWTRAAEAGDKRAQSGLGDLYRLGRGVPVDLALAVQWYGKAAGQDDPEAQYQLGRLVTEGAGGARLNTDEGLYWMKNAALHGHMEAQFAVAEAHRTGSNGALRVDPVEAAAWYGLASGGGHAEAAAAKAGLLTELSEQQRRFVEQREAELRSVLRR